MLENKDMRMARRIARQVAEAGGRTFFVGGFVRDRLRGKENKDIDIEIHGILPQTLEQILSELGTVKEMGVSFGIFGLKGYDLDIAMPRKEEATGRGHRDFAVYVDPFLGTYKAAIRRDFTMNALMEDVLTGEVVDHFGGIADMEAGVLRHVNPATFVEDPLRVLRAAQFAARFGFAVAEETVELAKTMDLTALARERILGELEKALLKAEKPSIFFVEMRKMEQMRDWFPEIEQLHAQGLWHKTMQVLDAAVKVRDKAAEPLSFMMLALTHTIEDAKARLRFLERVTNENKVIKYVENMAALYREPKRLFEEDADEKTTNAMFDKALAPAELLRFAVIEDGADIPGFLTGFAGQSTEKSTENIACKDLLQEQNFQGSAEIRLCVQQNVNLEYFLLERLAIFERVMAKPYVMGADLIRMGRKPNKSFSQILAYAHELRLAGLDKEEALAQTLEYANRLGL